VIEFLYATMALEHVECVMQNSKEKGTTNVMPSSESLDSQDSRICHATHDSDSLFAHLFLMIQFINGNRQLCSVI
jgi:hypothetical protein